MSDIRQKGKRTAQNEQGGMLGLFISALKSALIALFCSIMLSALLSAILLLSPDPLSLAFPSSLASLYLSAFISGSLCMKKQRNSTLLCGLFSGGLLMLLFAFISLFLPSDLSVSYSPMISILLHTLIIVFAFFGALTTKNCSSKRRRVKR